MFEKGQIVYHDNVVFIDGETDIKRYRPCVVLFSVSVDGVDYVCTCPFTSQVKSFDKYPNKYYFIPEQIYQYRKLSFANLNSVHLYREDETHDTGYKLDENTVNSVIDAFGKIKKSNTQINQIKYFLEYCKLFEQIEEREKAKLKRLERTKKRRDAKRFN